MKTPTHPLVKVRLILQAVWPSFWVWRELVPGENWSRFFRYVQPTVADVQDPAWASVHAKVMLFTAVWGLKPIVEHDTVGRAAVGKKFNGVVEFGLVSENFFLGVAVHEGRVTPFRGRPEQRPDVTIHFRDVPVALGALHNTLDTLAAIGLGEVTVRGNIPLADNLNLALERIADYFPSTLN